MGALDSHTLSRLGVLMSCHSQSQGCITVKSSCVPLLPASEGQQSQRLQGRDCRSNGLCSQFSECSRVKGTPAPHMLGAQIGGHLCSQAPGCSWSQALCYAPEAGSADHMVCAPSLWGIVEPLSMLLPGAWEQQQIGVSRL